MIYLEFKARDLWITCKRAPLVTAALFYIIPARNTLAATPEAVAISAPAKV